LSITKKKNKKERGKMRISDLANCNPYLGTELKGRTHQSSNRMGTAPVASLFYGPK